jgi:SHOCT-like protein
MTDSERQQILKMIEDGRITAEEGLKLMKALEEEPAEEIAPAVEPAPETGPGSEPEPDPHPEFAAKVNRFRSLWTIPLWIGVIITVGGAALMYTALNRTGMGFWFFCSWLPFLIGVAFIALAVGSRTARWLYLNVKQKPGETPQRIILAFPLPLGLITWVMNTFGHNIPNEVRGKSKDIVDLVFNNLSSDEPLFVDVKEEDGEHVQVYIG